MWQRLVKSVKEFSEFRRVRSSVVPAKGRAPKARRTWSMLGVKDADVSLLQDLVSSGQRMDELTNHPGWKDVLEAKQYYQSLADWKTKTPSLSEHDRFQAAVEWATIEGFFKEVYGRIRRGREAESKVSKFVRKT